MWVDTSVTLIVGFSMSRESATIPQFMQLELPFDAGLVEGSPQWLDLCRGMQYILPRLLELLKHGNGELRVQVKHGQVIKAPQFRDD